MSKQRPPATEIRPRQPFGFLLPKQLSGNFNAAGQLVEVQALPNYVQNSAKTEDLAEFRLVLGGLAQRGNRDAIFPVDIEAYLAPDNASEPERRSLDIIEGKSAMGFNIAVLAARTSGDKPVFLYVVEDKMRSKMVVAGSEKISDRLKNQLAKEGVSYVVKTSDECDRVVDDFLVAGAKHRNANGLLRGIDPRSTQFVVDDLIRSVSSLVEIRENGAGMRGDQKPHTLGPVIRQSGSKPECYTSITRPAQA